MNRQAKIEAIEQRILDEHRKYFQCDSPIEWARTAAVKIYSMFDNETYIRSLQHTDEIAEQLQQFYNPGITNQS